MLNNNGQLQASGTSFLDHQNRGIRYGDALFETMRSLNGIVFFLEEHYLRLMASMRILRMEIPMSFTMEYMEEQIRNTLEANQNINGPARIRLTVYRKPGGFYLPDTNDVAFFIETSKLAAPFYQFNEAAYEVELFKDFYLNADMLSNLKTNNKILNVVGSIYAKENGYNNCLLLNQSKQLVEALNANLFVVNKKLIKTPPLKDGCVKGIIRKNLIDLLLQDSDYTVEETSVSPFELQKADEIFITNTILGIRSISKYRKATFGNNVARECIEKLNSRIKKSVS